jgi:chromosomal replication initiator protein
MPANPSAQRMWEAVLGRLQLQVTRPSFDTWLRDTSGLSLDGQALVVGVPTTFAAEWLQRRMHNLIGSAVAAVTGATPTITYRVRGAAEEPVESTLLSGVATAPPRPPAHESGLNPRYTFDSFVVGPSNQLAYAASLAVADGPAGSYNPLYLYGDVGLGKTHLLQAIAHRAAAAGRRAAYVTCEQFTNEYVASIRERRTDQFRSRYRQMDVLLVDDIQFLSGKDGTQESFFHTFNALHGAGRQVVLASDRTPASLPLLEERLRSRFEWGLMADVGAPDHETRLAILRTRAADMPVAIDDGVLAYVAEARPGSVRQLEGSLNRIGALAHFTGRMADLELARSVIGSDPGTASHAALTPRQVIAEVARHYSLTPQDLTGGKRDRRTTAARHVAMYLLRTDLRCRPEAIGQVLGGRDRTTVLYGLQRIDHRLPGDNTLQRDLATITNSLRTTTEAA